MGPQTSCFSSLSTYLVPEVTTPPEYWLVSEYVFARSFPLAPAVRSERVGTGSLAVIIVTTFFLFVALVVGLLWFRTVRRKSSSKQTNRSSETTSGAISPEPGRHTLPEACADTFAITERRRFSGAQAIPAHDVQRSGQAPVELPTRRSVEDADNNEGDDHTSDSLPLSPISSIFNVLKAPMQGLKSQPSGESSFWHSLNHPDQSHGGESDMVSPLGDHPYPLIRHDRL